MPSTSRQTWMGDTGTSPQTGHPRSPSLTPPHRTFDPSASEKRAGLAGLHCTARAFLAPVRASASPCGLAKHRSYSRWRPRRFGRRFVVRELRVPVVERPGMRDRIGTYLCGGSATGRLALAITVLLASLVLAQAATPAGASPTGPGVRPGKNSPCSTNPTSWRPLGTGWEELTVDLFRGPHKIASASGPAVDTPEGPGLEVNHGPGGRRGSGRLLGRGYPRCPPRRPHRGDRRRRRRTRSSSTTSS